MPAEKLFEVPNLDDISIDPDDYRQLVVVFGILQEYANTKHQAMRYRTFRELMAALRLEAHLEVLYDQLPEWARW